MHSSFMPHSKQPEGNYSVSIALATIFIFFVIAGYASYWNTFTINRNAALVTRTHEIILALDNLFTLVKDAETGQRGYVITGDPNYLAPHSRAVTEIPSQIAQIHSMIADSPEQKARFASIEPHITAKLSELDETILLRRDKGFEASRAVVVTDRGKNEMDIIRAGLSEMQEYERTIRTRRLEEMASAYHIAVITNLLTGLLGVVLTVCVGYLIFRANNQQKRQLWMQTGEVQLSSTISGEFSIEELGDKVLTFLAQYFDAQAGAFYHAKENTFRRAATYGLPDADAAPMRFHAGEGLLGQSVRDHKPCIVHDVPTGYLKIGSALGRGEPKHLIIFPVGIEGNINAVFELGFIHRPNALALELLGRVQEAIAIAVRSANYRAHLQSLLEETQRQSEELQSQSEELRVSNEELEEQSRALKASQTNLEQQQAELEQTNAQLEEQTQLLEDERDNLSLAQTALQAKTQELEQASRYKSDFLANMSHELRTPLNSSLILAKLLADNPAGNLTAEQVKHAQTIQSAGNDLLSLINDILDLSKIEAGHMEVHAETIQVRRLVDDLMQIFTPLAKDKQLTLEKHILAHCPRTLHTDRQRLEQILRNLLSNAIKFTEAGKVSLTVDATEDGRIAFSVTDTGIGITPDTQELIFDAFRQADSTISRKYGGTGLGLSISRELARLLGGSIQLSSKPGHGSTFTIFLPPQYDAGQVSPRNYSSVSFTTKVEPLAMATAAPVAAKLPQVMDDDRDQLDSKARVILIVEDDTAFARILLDVVHEMKFQCIIVASAQDAVQAAIQYLPHAILLDIGLPDDSGLTVLDRLKHDNRTRHIPIHVVSGNDYMQTALTHGAAGYALKPVKREEVKNILEHLETLLSQQVHRVLVVEDDPVQRESIGKLLRSDKVSIVEAGTAAECLKLMERGKFDCLILDLSLPDASGYSLLETLSKNKDASIPPVIIYTGRDLSSADEQKLRRYSRSIIIKGAKSPERLLDEVTLFLHQMVSGLPPEQQQMLEKVKSRDEALDGRHILIAEDDVRNVYALTSMLEQHGVIVTIARNGREALQALDQANKKPENGIDMVLMDVMMPEMDGLTATREIRKRDEWKKLPIIVLTAKAMKEDQERCIAAGANDYIAKPLNVERLLSLVRVWMPR